jgi:glycosyltransferase involved in cell wall biosynthesis
MKPTILITAYAVNPFKGSEDGIGWNIIKHLAEHNDITAITRRNNRPNIERYLESNPLPAGQQLHFEYFDLPKWLCFWKKGGRGALLYHYLWHLGVVFFILNKKFSYDLAHHLNFNSDWTPSWLWLLGKPYVWGPVGHHHKIPRSYILPAGKKAWLKDRLMWYVKCYFWKISPFLKISKWTASKVIGLNTSVFEVMKVAAEKQAVIAAAANEIPDVQPIANKKFQVLSIGRFVPLKGFDLTIRAFAASYQRQTSEVQARMQLTLIGKGPEKQRLQEIALECELFDDAVRFVDWMDREELSRFFAASKVFFFPSHEGAGMVVPEALSFGVPVLCFDNYGPGEFVDKSCAVKVPYTSYDQSVREFSEALDLLLHDEKYRQSLAENALTRFQQKYTWKKKALQIQAIYDEILTVSPALATA